MQLRYIEELRWRVYYVLQGFVISGIICWESRMYIMDFLLKLQPDMVWNEMYVMSMTESFSTSISVILGLSAIGVIVLIWIQILAFVNPGLYRREQKRLWGLVVISQVLMWVGIIFSVKYLIPRVWEFFTTFEGVTFIPGFKPYINLFFTVITGMICCFQIPVIVYLLLHWGWLSKRWIVKGRPWVICGLLFVAACITPPDLGSQCLVFVPMWVSYEILVILLLMIKISEIKGEKERWDRR